MATANTSAGRGPTGEDEEEIVENLCGEQRTDQQEKKDDELQRVKKENKKLREMIRRLEVKLIFKQIAEADEEEIVENLCGEQRTDQQEKKEDELQRVKKENKKLREMIRRLEVKLIFKQIEEADVPDSLLAPELETLDIKDFKNGAEDEIVESLSGEQCIDQQEKEEDKLRRENGELRKENKILRSKIRELGVKLIHEEIEKAEKPRFDHALEKNIQELLMENEELKTGQRYFRSLYDKKKQENKELREENKILQKGVEDLQEMPDQAMQVQDVSPFRVREEDQHGAAEKLYFISESGTALVLSDYPNQPGQQSDANEELGGQNCELKEDVEDGNKQLKHMEKAKKGNKSTNEILDKIRDLAKDSGFFNCKVSCGKLCVLSIFRVMDLKFCREKLFIQTSMLVEKGRSDTFHPDECQFFVHSLLRLGIVKSIYKDNIREGKPFSVVLQEAKDAFRREKSISIGLILFGFGNTSRGHCIVIFHYGDELQIYDVQKARPWVETPNYITYVKLIQVALVVEGEAKKLLKTCGVTTCCPA